MGASQNVPRRSSEFGSLRSGWGPNGELIQGEIQLTRPAVDAIITVGANQAAGITVQLNNSDGSAINYSETIEIDVLLSSAGLDWAATGGSTGIAIGANGKLLAAVAKKSFRGKTDTSGVIKLTWTDNAAEAAYLGVRLPNGRVVVSAALPTT